MPVPPAPNPTEMLAQLRAHWVNLHAAAQARGGPPAGVKLSSPAETPIARMQLPAALQSALEAQQAPGTPVEWVKLLHAVNGRITTAVDDGSPLPDDAHLVQVQVTTVAVRAGEAQVEVYVVIGNRGAAALPHPLPGPGPRRGPVPPRPRRPRAGQ